MDVSQINAALAVGDVTTEGVLPHLEELRRTDYVFEHDFGLEELPEEPGLLTVRGARQVGKSTWLEGRIRATVEAHGPGSAFYLNGDELGTSDDLLAAIRELAAAFSRAVATAAGSMSTPSARAPSFAAASASTPEPQPTSSTRSPGRASRSMASRQARVVK